MRVGWLKSCRISVGNRDPEIGSGGERLQDISREPGAESGEPGVWSGVDECVCYQVIVYEGEISLLSNGCFRGEECTATDEILECLSISKKRGLKSNFESS